MANYRADTRDRMHDCGCHDPAPMPPYPAPVMPASVFEEMMYRVAYAAGYLGNRNEFREDLANALNGADSVGGLVIQKGSVEEFPDIGLENAIYIDTEKNQIYYWKGDGYYRIETDSSSGGGGEGGEGETIIPSDGLTYDGGEI